MTTIVLAFIIACATMLGGGVMGAAQQAQYDAAHPPTVSAPATPSAASGL